MTETHGHSAAHDSVDYERGDTNQKQIIFVGVFSVIALIACLFALDDYFTLTVEEHRRDTELSVMWPGLREIRIAEQEALTKYKLLSADSGRYQLPIEHAMRLMVEEAFQAGK
ncbi:MAG: hypothetical protein ACE5GA_09065 [Candidatus Zixiibacteriota bacterium]